MPTSCLAKTVSILFYVIASEAKQSLVKTATGFTLAVTILFYVIASVSEAILKNEVIFAKDHHGLMSS